jgi:hypothetical protein
MASCVQLLVTLWDTLIEEAYMNIKYNAEISNVTIVNHMRKLID